MRGEKRLNIFLLLPFLVLLIFLPIPRQDKLVCEFDDGDRMIVRQRYAWQPIAEFIAHVHNKTYADEARIFYKPKYRSEKWKPIDLYDSIRSGFTDIEYRLEYCSKFRKLNNIISTTRLYKFQDMPFQESPFWRGVFKNDEEVRSNLFEKKLSTEAGFSLSLEEKTKLLIEAPLVSIEKKCYSFTNKKNRHETCPVAAVLQSRSTDNGQTWSTLELTTDAKLYELGLPIFEQKGVAKPVDWTGKPWFGKDE